MKKQLSLLVTIRIVSVHLLLFCASLLHTAEAQDLIFAKGFSNSMPMGGGIQARGIAVDAAGNRYLIGNFDNTADFDLGPGTQNLTSAGILSDIFLVKYDAAGNYVWAQRMGGTGADIGYAVAVDATGNSYITGHFSGTVDFDPGAGTQNLTSNGSYDIFLAKYDASGNYVWARNMGNSSGDDIGYGIAIDASGNSYITGYFTGSVDFDPGAGTETLNAASGNDIFLAKYDAAGNYGWAKPIGGAGSDIGNKVAVDASGNIYITGSFESTNVDFDPGAGTQFLSSNGNNDIFIAKYDASGNYSWANSIGSTGGDIGVAVALDASGNCYITGYFVGTNVDFDPGPGTQNLTSAGILSDIFLAKYDASGIYDWAKRIGGSDTDAGIALGLDASGNIYLTGYFSGTADFDPGAGTQNLNAAGNFDIFEAKYDASGNYGWARRIGGAGSDAANALAVDASGNSYSTGSFTGTVDFDPGAGTASLTTGALVPNTYSLQLNSTGDYVSAGRLGGYDYIVSHDQGKSIMVDASGNSYVTGYFSGTVDFDPGAGTENLTSAGSTDIFLAKYDVTGNYVWARSMGSAGSDQGSALAIDASGNCYITGFFVGIVDFDPGAGTQNLSANGSGSDIFLAKYDASGNYVWAQSMGSSTNNDEGNAMAVDASGNCFITGDFAGTVDFDPGAGTQNLTSNGNNDIFLAKYDASGNYIWAGNIGGGGSDIGSALAIDASGNSYITGSFAGTNIDFDPGAGTQNLSSSSGSTDFFLAKYDAAGNYVWAKSIGGTQTDIGNGLAVDASGNSYITGSFANVVDFDPGAGVRNLSSSGSNTDIFLAKYDASGNYAWAKRIGGSSIDAGYGLAIDASGNSYITGYFGGTVDFDPGAGVQALVSTGNSDIFLAKYNAVGNYVWAKNMGGSNTDVAYAVAINASGNSYITGYFNATADFDPGTGTQNLVSLNGTDLFIAQYGPSTPLPIRLESFAGRLIDNDAAVLLQWTSAAQEDHAYFEVQRSPDGHNFTTLGKVAGCGTCYDHQQYHHTDYQPLAGKVHYRLKMVDKDGKAEYSKWISIYKNGEGRPFVLYPTVTTGRVEVFYDLAGTARNLRISIFDIKGRAVQQRQEMLTNGSNQLHFDLSAQPAGLYYVQLTEQNGQILATGSAIRQ